jgi:hypothetical protein
MPNILEGGLVVWRYVIGASVGRIEACFQAVKEERNGCCDPLLVQWKTFKSEDYYYFHRPESSRPDAMFRMTSRLLDCRITLFTRVNCSLCDTAKAVVGNVKEQRPFEYQEIDVMRPGQEKWKSLYEFDTPVVRSRVWCRERNVILIC